MTDRRDRRLAALLPPVTHGSMTDAVTEALREAIVSGLLAPQEWLREDDLARVFEVSRTPVREALRRLSDERLAVRVANRGTMVAPITTDEIIAVYAVRESLEALSAASAASRRDAGLLDSLMAVHRLMVQTDPKDVDRLAELNLQFHGLIRGSSGNAMLEGFLAQVEAAVRRFGQTTYSVRERVAQSNAEHVAIIEAIASGDAQAASERTAEHMRHARDLRVRQALLDHAS